MKNIYSIIMCLSIILSGCVTTETDSNTITSSSNSSASVVVISSSDINVEKPLEQVPSKLSIEHFSGMKLEGSDLRLEKVLTANAVYTRHQISYKSNGLTISGIMNIPKGDGKFPLVILNHGYIDPAIYTVGRGLKREQDYFALPLKNPNALGVWVFLYFK